MEEDAKARGLEEQAVDTPGTPVGSLPGEHPDVAGQRTAEPAGADQPVNGLASVRVGRTVTSRGPAHRICRSVRGSFSSARVAYLANRLRPVPKPDVLSVGHDADRKRVRPADLLKFR